MSTSFLLSTDLQAASQELHAEVIIPLRLEQAFTYRVPVEMQSQIAVGMRVLVQFGSRKLYYGIVSGLGHRLVRNDSTPALKEILHLPDQEPLVTSLEIEQWKWAAAYYCCPIGTMLSAVLPANYLPSSDTEVRWMSNASADQTYRYTEETEHVIAELKSCRQQKCKTTTLIKRLGNSIMKEVERMVRAGLLQTNEYLNTSARTVGEAHIRLATPYCSEEGLEELFAGLKRAFAQRRLLETLLIFLEERGLPLDGAMPQQQLTAQDPNKQTALRALLQKEYVERIYMTPPPSAFDLAWATATLPQTPVLSHEKPNVRLVQTPQEQLQLVYSYAQKCYYSNQSILILFPSIHPLSLSSALQEALEAKQIPSYTYYTYTADKDKIEIRRQLLQRTKPLIVIGTRLAALLPLECFAMAIVCDEEDSNYKQMEPAPRFHARDYLLVGLQKLHLPLLLCSLTPSVEVMHLLKEKRYIPVKETKEISAPHTAPYAAPQPNIQVVDLVAERKKQALTWEHLVSLPLRDALRDNAARGLHAIITLNRKGYAPRMFCQECGWVISCPHCSVSLVYHKKTASLKCHYCGYTTAIPAGCSSCGSVDSLQVSGFGLERISEELTQAIPSAQIIQVELKKINNPQAAEELKQKLANGAPTILIGTRSMAYFRPLPKMGLVGILNLEQLTAGVEFRATESGFAFILRYAKNYPGLPIWIQTHKPDQPFLSMVQQGNLSELVKQELTLRELLHYPPFCRLINIHLRSRNQREVEYIAQGLVFALQQRLPYATVLGPITPYIAWIRLMHLRHLTLKVPLQAPWKEVRNQITQTIEILSQQIPAVKRTDIYCDIDPR